MKLPRDSDGAPRPSAASGCPAPRPYAASGRRTAAQVVVLSTGCANLASVCAGLRRAGAAPRLSDSPAEAQDAARVVLPGVGSFAPAMDALEDSGLAAALRRRVAAGRPTLAICLGLQLLSQGSEECPGRPGLAVVAGRARALRTLVPEPDAAPPAGDGAPSPPTVLPMPQMGWNQVEPDPACRLLRPGWAYYANGYGLDQAPSDWGRAWSRYGGRFVAALERGPLLACQFHPELSGAWGEDLLRRWLHWPASEPCQPRPAAQARSSAEGKRC